MNERNLFPNYTITPRIADSLEAIDRNQWLIGNVLLMPKHAAWMQREAWVRRASGTTRIEGAGLDEAAVSRLAKQPLLTTKTLDEQDSINALQACEFIDFLSGQEDIPVDELVLRQLNRYFIPTAGPNLTPGAYRHELNPVSGFQAPEHADVPGLMRSFALWLRIDDDSLHPAIKASLAHLHTVAIQPF